MTMIMKMSKLPIGSLKLWYSISDDLIVENVKQEAVSYQQILYMTLGLLALIMFLKTLFEDFSKGNAPEATTTPAYVQNRARNESEYQRVTQDYTQREKLKLYQSSQF
jgi:hypothetical protein